MKVDGYLLDTDCVIHCLKGMREAIEHVRKLEPAVLALSLITYAELWEGVYYARDPKASQEKLDEFIANVIMLPVTDAICRRFGQIRGHLRKSGKPTGDFDLLIAATALEHNLVLISNNRRHFENIHGLRLESI